MLTPKERQTLANGIGLRLTRRYEGRSVATTYRQDENYRATDSALKERSLARVELVPLETVGTGLKQNLAWKRKSSSLATNRMALH